MWPEISNPTFLFTVPLLSYPQNEAPQSSQMLLKMSYPPAQGISGEIDLCLYFKLTQTITV